MLLNTKDYEMKGLFISYCDCDNGLINFKNGSKYEGSIRNFLF